MSRDAKGTLAARLRELRSNMPQRDLATLMNVSGPLVSSWETGAVVPPKVRLEQYALYFQREDPNTLLSDLLRLRITALDVHQSETSIVVVLQDIREMLGQILDRLPPSLPRQP
jgi:transcriptional regulator with XRE-family HTH domain